MRRQHWNVMLLLFFIYFFGLTLTAWGLFYWYENSRFLIREWNNLNEKSIRTGFMLCYNAIEILLEGGMAIGIGIGLMSFTPSIQAMKYAPEENALLQRNTFQEQGYPDVDVFVPVKGLKPALVERLFKSVRQQVEFPQENIKLYLGLDRPTETEIHAYQKICDAYDASLVVLKENKHFKAGNLNNLLKHSSSPYFIVVDVDHQLFPTTIHDLTLSIVNASENTAFVQGKTLYKGNGNTMCIFGEMMYARYYEIAEHQKEKLGTTLTSGSTVIFKRSHINAINGFQVKTYTEDVETATALIINGYHGRYLNKTSSVGASNPSYSGTMKQIWRWFHGPLAITRIYGKKIINSKHLNALQKLDLLNNGLLFIIITLQFMYGLFLSLHYWLNMPFLRSNVFYGIPISMSILLLTVFMDSMYNFVAVLSMRKRDELHLTYLDIIRNEMASVACFLPNGNSVLYGLMNWHGVDSKHASWNQNIRVFRNSIIYALIGLYQVIIGWIILSQSEINGLTIIAYGLLFFVPLIFYLIYK